MYLCSYKVVNLWAIAYNFRSFSVLWWKHSRQNVENTKFAALSNWLKITRECDRTSLTRTLNSWENWWIVSFNTQQSVSWTSDTGTTHEININHHNTNHPTINMLSPLRKNYRIWGFCIMMSSSQGRYFGLSSWFELKQEVFDRYLFDRYLFGEELEFFLSHFIIDFGSTYLPCRVYTTLRNLQKRIKRLHFEEKESY